MKRRLGDIEGRHSDWSSNGFLSTGDLFQTDDDGYLFFTGRLSDFAVISGDKVNLASVRNIVCQIPGIVSSHINLLYDDSKNPCGYELCIIADDARDANVASIVSTLRTSLRPSERPSKLNITVNDNTDIYK